MRATVIDCSDRVKHEAECVPLSKAVFLLQGLIPITTIFNEYRRIIMGQQQLLLVILVTILVGIATVVAMNVFGGAAEDANRDAVRQDIMQGATTAQAIYARPVMLDGAGGDFSDIPGDGTDAEKLIRRLGMPITLNGNEWSNANGTYAVSNVEANSFRITGTPSSGGDNIVAEVSYSTENGTWDITWSPGNGSGGGDGDGDG